MDDTAWREYLMEKLQYYINLNCAYRFGRVGSGKLVLDPSPERRPKESVNLYLKMVLFVSDYIHISLGNLKNAGVL